METNSSKLSRITNKKPILAENDSAEKLELRDLTNIKIQIENLTKTLKNLEIRKNLEKGKIN